MRPGRGAGMYLFTFERKSLGAQASRLLWCGQDARDPRNRPPKCEHLRGERELRLSKKHVIMVVVGGIGGVLVWKRLRHVSLDDIIGNIIGTN